MSNGICKIKVKGTDYTLRFQRAAVQYIAETLGKDFVANPFKSTLELVYAGMLNESVFRQSAAPSWEEVYNLVDDFHDEEDATEQLTAVNKAFEDGRWGGDFMRKIEELKKKMEGMELEQVKNLAGQTLEDTV